MERLIYVTPPTRIAPVPHPTFFCEKKKKKTRSFCPSLFQPLPVTTYTLSLKVKVPFCAISGYCRTLHSFSNKQSKRFIRVDLIHYLPSPPTLQPLSQKRDPAQYITRAALSLQQSSQEKHHSQDKATSVTKHQVKTSLAQSSPRNPHHHRQAYTVAPQQPPTLRKPHPISVRATNTTLQPPHPLRTTKAFARTHSFPSQCVNQPSSPSSSSPQPPPTPPPST